MSSSPNNRAATLAPPTDACARSAAPERARHLRRPTAELMGAELSTALSDAIAAHGLSQVDIAAACDVTHQRISRACNADEPRHTLGTHYVLALCHHKDARLSAVGRDYLRAVVALAGLGDIVEARPADGAVLVVLSAVQREASEGVAAIIEIADGTPSAAELAHTERQCLEAGDAFHAVVARVRAQRMGAM